MKNHLLGLVLLGALAFCNCIPSPLSTDELEARKFVENANERMNTITEQTRDLTYKLDTIENWELLGHYDKIKKVMDDMAALVRDSLKFDTSQFKDEELKYIFKIIRHSAGEIILGNWRYEGILKAMNVMEELGYRRLVPKYQNKKEKVAYFKETEKIIAYTNNTRELKYYWKEWRENVWDSVRWNLGVITKGIFEAANETGISPLDLYMEDFNITEMERIMNETQPLYNQLHAFVRYQLNKKYGDSIIRPNGVIPDHLFRQVEAQTWTNASVIESSFPLNKLPNFNKLLQDKNFDSTDLYKMADQFYKSLGFDSIPESFWGTEIRMSQKRDEGDCKPSFFDMSPNVFLFFCKKMDFRTFLQAHRYMGQMYYARERTGLPSYYSEAHDLEASVGEAGILSASTFDHLKAVRLLENYEVTEEAELNRLIRMGFHTLLSVRQQFIHAKVLADVFAGKHQMEVLNKQYWKLMEQFLGVGPPLNRLTKTLDFPYKFYIEVNENHEGRKFNNEIFGYQLHKKLCQVSGKYSKGDLHNCDFYGSRQAGDFLKKFMKLGASKPLPQFLEAVFPENPKFSSDAILDYYSPMEAWLIQKNKEANVRLGWTPSTKKVKETSYDDYDEYE